MNSMKKVTAALILGIISVSVFAQDFKTATKVAKGQEYNYQNSIVTEITQTMGGQEMKVNSTSNATTKYVIDNVLSSGNVEVLTSVWDLSSKTKAPMMDTTMTYSGKVSPTYKIIIDKHGNFISKEKMDTTGISGLNAAFDVDNKLSGSGMFCEFPAKDLKVGEKWSKSYNDSVNNMAGKLGLVVNTDYTLGATENVDGKAYQKVSYTSNIEIGGKNKMQGMDLFIEGTGVQNGNLLVDPVSKVIYNNKSDIELDMNIAVTGPQNMTIPVSQKMTVTQTLKK